MGCGHGAHSGLTEVFCAGNNQRRYGLRTWATRGAGIAKGDASPLPHYGYSHRPAGFGDSTESCAKTIEAGAAIGLAGGSNEDHTGDKTDPIYPFELAVARICAACEARDALKTDFVLTARYENFLWD